MTHGNRTPSAPRPEDRALEFAANVLAASPHGMFIKDERGGYVLANGAMCSLLGARLEEFLGKVDADLLEPAAVLQLSQLESTARSSSEPVTKELLLNLPSKRRTLMVTLCRLRDSCGTSSFLVGTWRDTTERRWAEDLLLELEERQHIVADATLDAYYDWDLVHRSNWCNRGYATLFGGPSSEEAPLKWWEARIHPNDRATVRELMRSALESRVERWRAEYRLKAASGHYVTVLDRGLISYDLAGRALRFTGAILDMSELEATRGALRQSEERHRLLIEQAPDGILLLGSDGRCLEANRAFCELAEHTRESLYWTSLGDLFGATDGPSLLRTLRETPAGTIVRSLLELRRSGGQSRPVEVLAKHLADGTVQTFVRDISERREYERQIDERDRLLTAVIDTAIDAVIVTDQDGYIVRVNPSAGQLFGFEAGALTGLHLGELLPSLEGRAPLDGEKDQGVWQDVAARRRDGHSFPAEHAVSAFDVGGRRRYASIIRDISERASVERHIADAETRLRTMVAFDLHDSVSQILTGGRMLASNLARDLPEPLKPRMARIVELVGDAQNKVRALSQLLSAVDASMSSLEDALSSLAEKASTSYGIPCSFESGKLPGEPTETQQHQVFLVAQEALLNAVRHGRAHQVRLRLAVENDEYILRVGDDGCGLRGEGRGSGIGLASMRYRARLLQGRLEIHTGQPSGTEVVLRWPAAPAVQT